MAVTEVRWLKNNNVNISLGHPQEVEVASSDFIFIAECFKRLYNFYSNSWKMKEKKIISGQQAKYCSNLTPDIIAA